MRLQLDIADQRVDKPEIAARLMEVVGWVKEAGAFFSYVRKALGLPVGIGIAFVAGTALSVFIGLAMEDFSSAETAARPYLDGSVTSWSRVRTREVDPGQYHGVQVTATITFQTTLLGIVPRFRTLTITETAGGPFEIFKRSGDG